MKEVYWIDIDVEKPEKGQSIFYLDQGTVDYLERLGAVIVANDDIDKGIYMQDNLVEWHYDYPSEEFKYWYPVPRIFK